VKYSVVIATHNRAPDLRETLTSLQAITTAQPWEVIVVDNKSSDDTPIVVGELAKRYPVPLRYVFEPVPGRSAALNTGIAAARGEIIVTTDDDVRVACDWIDRAGAALDQLGCDYVGGRVLPIWGAARPRWLPNRGGRHWAVIALLDYGPDVMEFGEKVPLGVNMAFRRNAFDIAGAWDPRIGRKAGTLLGQEVREWCLRARAKGLRGFYVPGMIVHHIIPANRLSKRYFRRWFYWRGISRALLYLHQGLNMDAPESTRIDFALVPHVFGVPRYLFRTAFMTLVDVLKARVRRDPVAAFEHELWLWMFAGIVHQRWHDRRQRLVWTRSPASQSV
jgi:GT2 family glycosyltransferase